MKITTPRLEERPAQPTVGIRVQVPMKKMNKMIPGLLSEVFAWLEAGAVEPVGPPFLRFHVIDMQADMDIEAGVPVAQAAAGDGRIQPGLLPAGRYAALTYTGVKNGIKGNRALLDWAAQQGLVWDRWEDEKGDAFACRYETYLTSPDHEPDQAKWETEVAIRLADKQPASLA